MTSFPVRDQANDHLLTPKNCALLVIDYQPVQVGSIASMDRRNLVLNIVAVARTANSTACRRALDGEREDRSQPADHPSAAGVLDGIEAIDRTTINAGRR